MYKSSFVTLFIFYNKESAIYGSRIAVHAFIWRIGS